MELAVDLLDFLVDFFLFVEMPPFKPEVQEHLVPTKGGVGAVAEGAAGEAAKNKRKQHSLVLPITRMEKEIANTVLWGNEHRHPQQQEEEQ